MIFAARILLTALLATRPNVVIADPGADYLTTIIQPLVTESLVDPDSAKFYWPYGFFNAGDRLVTCGFVNAKNRMGGYSGKSSIIVAYIPGNKPYFNMAEEENRWDGVAGACQEYLKTGRLNARVGQSLP